MKHSSINQTLIKARKAFAKAARALPEYDALQKARAAHERRQASVEQAQRRLKSILKSKAPVSAEALAAFRLAATAEGYEELGRDKVDDIIGVMRGIEKAGLRTRAALAARIEVII
jgi:hypothetical protein